MNWQEVADEAAIMKSLDLDPKRDLEIAYLKTEKGFLELLELILRFDLKIRILSMENKGENCDGIKGRAKILEHHIKRIAREALAEGAEETTTKGESNDR